MKIEFLADGAEHCPLIRMYDYREGEVKILCEACRDLADGRLATFALHEQPWVQPVLGCRFSWRAEKKDYGVKSPTGGNEFILLYSEEAWREVEDKLLHVADDHTSAVNWLTNEGDVRVLISGNGSW